MPTPQNHRPHFVFSGGVTGGHLFPGLAVAARISLLAPEAQITFCGPGGALDRGSVERAGHAYLELACPKSPRVMWRFPRFAQRMLQGEWQAEAFLRRHPVSAVVGLGGFGSAPMALAAARRRVPLMLIEQNVVMGRANRWLSRWAQLLCLAFNETAQTPRKRLCRTIVTGTPIRSQFCSPVAKNERVLLVLGGSGGARALNEAAPIAFAGMKAALEGWRIVHQSGASDQAATEAVYREAGIEATVVPFISNMAAALAGAGLAVCRAGGSTLAELAVTQTPAILVPYPQAADDHQRQNALRFERAGAAKLVDSQGLPPNELTRRLRCEISRLLADRPARQRMAQAMASLGRPNAAEQIAELALHAAMQQNASISDASNSLFAGQNR